LNGAALVWPLDRCAVELFESGRKSECGFGPCRPVQSCTSHSRFARRGNATRSANGAPRSVASAHRGSKEFSRPRPIANGCSPGKPLLRSVRQSILREGLDVSQSEGRFVWIALLIISVLSAVNAITTIVDDNLVFTAATIFWMATTLGATIAALLVSRRCPLLWEERTQRRRRVSG